MTEGRTARAMTGGATRLRLEGVPVGGLAGCTDREREGCVGVGADAEVSR